jgi:hypothetical protein
LGTSRDGRKYDYIVTSRSNRQRSGNFSICADGSLLRRTQHCSEHCSKEARNPISSMVTVWSRWLLGAWAAATAVWLVVATLMLVQTWPEPSLRSANDTSFEQMETPSQIGRAMRGQLGGATSVQKHLAIFMLATLAPPAILLMFVLAGIRLAGLPLPSLRQAARKRSVRPKS